MLLSGSICFSKRDSNLNLVSILIGTAFIQPMIAIDNALNNFDTETVRLHGFFFSVLCLEFRICRIFTGDGQIPMFYVDIKADKGSLFDKGC